MFTFLEHHLIKAFKTLQTKKTQSKMKLPNTKIRKTKDEPRLKHLRPSRWEPSRNRSTTIKWRKRKSTNPTKTFYLNTITILPPLTFRVLGSHFWHPGILLPCTRPLPHLLPLPSIHQAQMLAVLYCHLTLLQD